MRSTPIKQGTIANSLMGRDAGRRFLVVQEVDENFVMVVDGKLRTMDRPKKKRRKHLCWVGECEAAAEIFSKGKAPENHEVRKWLFDEEE